MSLPFALILKILSWIGGFAPFIELLRSLISLVYDLLIKLIGLIFYLASEYWGRWVLVAFVVTGILLYGRYHYIQQGRQFEAKFCELRIDDALRESKKARKSVIPPSSQTWPLDIFGGF